MKKVVVTMVVVMVTIVSVVFGINFISKIHTESLNERNQFKEECFTRYEETKNYAYWTNIDEYYVDMEDIFNNIDEMSVRIFEEKARKNNIYINVEKMVEEFKEQYKIIFLEDVENLKKEFPEWETNENQKEKLLEKADDFQNKIITPYIKEIENSLKTNISSKTTQIMD